MADTGDEMPALQDALHTLLADKATELFNDYGVTCIARDAEPLAERQLCGILGFTGDQLCGSVVIAATAPAVACSNPIQDGATRAWVAELTNQLVGRFKNALFRGGIEVAMSVPVVLTATTLAPMPQDQTKPIFFAVGEGTMTVWLEFEATAGLELGEPSADAAMAAEGEAMLF